MQLKVPGKQKNTQEGDLITIDKEVVLRHVLPSAYSGTPIVPEVEYACLDS